jgi:hypothetical protein
MEEDRIEQIMKDFKKVIVDMTRDILITFPDRHNLNNLNGDLKNVLENTDNEENTSLKSVFEHCKEVYPNKFFNILYQNDTIFADDDSLFLPGISFKELWQDPLLSDKSREVIWKYLQLVLFTVISTVKDKESFGDSAKLFESINEDELKSKLEETMAQMQDIFNLHKGAGEGTEGVQGEEGEGEEGSAGSTRGEGINLGDMPNPQDIHDHVTGMLDGKLGRLAKEIAEETAADLNMDMNSSDSVNDMFKNLMKNPTKLMGIVKNVGSKLDEKMKSGDIKESDLLKEAGDIMEKMKNIPGMGNIQSMMEKMGMGANGMGGAGGGGMGANAMGSMMNSMMSGMMGGGGASANANGANAMGGKGKVNVNAFQEYMKKNMKAQKHKEGMKARLAERQAQQMQAQQMQAQQTLAEQEEMQIEAEPQQQTQAQQTQKHGSLKKVNDNLVFSTGEEVLRSLAPLASTIASTAANTDDGEEKKKKKKKKNKKQ